MSCAHGGSDWGLYEGMRGGRWGALKLSLNRGKSAQWPVSLRWIDPTALRFAALTSRQGLGERAGLGAAVSREGPNRPCRKAKCYDNVKVV